MRLIIILSLFGLGATSGAMLHAHAMNPADAGTQSASADTAMDDGKEAQPAGENSAYARLCVAPGDTLWKIAKTYAPEGVNVKAYIQDIMEANRLDSASLQVGQVLILP